MSKIICWRPFSNLKGLSSLIFRLLAQVATLLNCNSLPIASILLTIPSLSSLYFPIISTNVRERLGTNIINFSPYLCARMKLNNAGITRGHEIFWSFKGKAVGCFDALHTLRIKTKSPLLVFVTFECDLSQWSQPDLLAYPSFGYQLNKGKCNPCRLKAVQQLQGKVLVFWRLNWYLGCATFPKETSRASEVEASDSVSNFTWDISFGARAPTTDSDSVVGKMLKL